MSYYIGELTKFKCLQSINVAYFYLSHKWRIQNSGQGDGGAGGNTGGSGGIPHRKGGFRGPSSRKSKQNLVNKRIVSCTFCKEIQNFFLNKPGGEEGEGVACATVQQLFYNTVLNFNGKQ